MITFNRRFLLFTIVLFIIEVFIALFVRDNFIRPYGGDFLVVILIYCAVRTFVHVSPLKIAIGVLLFSYLVETLQYFRLVDRLGLTQNLLAKTVIGYGFEWLDMLAYTLGIFTVPFVEWLNKRGRLNRSVQP